MATAITSACPSLPALPALPSSGQAVVAASDGSIAGDLKIISTTKDGELATCELRIANETSTPLLYQLAIVQDGKSSPLSLTPLTLPPGSALATTINVRRLDGAAPQRLVGTLQAAHASLTVEAPLPWRSQRAFTLRPWKIVAMLFAIAGMLEIAAFAYRPIRDVPHTAAVVARMPQQRHRLVRVVHPARVVTLSLDSQKVAAGGLVTAHYEAIGESGTVRLVDGTGTIWSQVPMRSDGLARLKAPDVPTDQAMRVVLTVNHAGTTATSNVGVIVAASPSLDGTVSGVAPQQETAPTHSVTAGPLRDPEGIMSVSKGRFAGGATIPVRILRQEDHLRIALQYADGSEISAVNVSPGSRSISLVAPDTGTVQTYTILASYLRGVSEQISVIPITLYPR